MRVHLLDYGVGNIHSVRKALERCGARVTTVSDAERLLDARCAVLPGVGSFGASARAVARCRSGLRARLAGGMPCLGICVGMQLLYEKSRESPGRGLGLLKGTVRRLRAPVVPHMGWSPVFHRGGPLFDSISPGAYFYFAHSYAPPPTEDAAATTDCGTVFPSAVGTAHTFGVQFHPEKSGAAGLRLIGNFLAQAEGWT